MIPSHPESGGSPSVLAEKRTSAENPRIRMRAIVLGIVLSALICAITPYNNAYLQGTYLGGGYFPLAPFFILFWLTLAIGAIRKIFGGRLLTGRELLVTWILTVLASGIAYTGLVRTFFINLTAPYYFGTPENRWSETLQPLLPSLWYPHSKEAVNNLYNGLAGGRQMGWWDVLRQIPWHTWMVPLAVWGLFILLCYFVMICIVNLLSGQPLYKERMNFPLLRVPQLMEEALDAGKLGSFLTNRYLLVGILVPVFLHLVNGLNFYYPDVPQIPTLILAGSYFPRQGLFAGFYKLKIYIYPAFIGFAFLTSKQISFSFWFFYILGGLLMGLLTVLGYNIPAAALGITFGPTLTRPEETQMIGAYGVFFLYLLWLARHHLWGVFRQGAGFEKEVPTDTQWLSTRFSFWGFVVGGLGIVAWCHYFGLPLLTAVLVIGVFFMVMLVAMRVICQGGIAYFTLTVAPIDGLMAFFGPKFFTNAGILIAAVAQKVLFVDLRESLMPSLLHASKISHKTRNRGTILGGIMVTLIAAVGVSFVAMLAICYKFGIRELGLDWATRTTVAVYENINSLVQTPVHPGHWVFFFTAMGAVVMTVLALCYHRLYWWPLHPIGYLTAYSSAMWILWFSFFAGWLANALCMRYGGVALYRRLRYFFIGLIIGDFLMAGFWAIIGIFSFASYQVLPS